MIPRLVVLTDRSQLPPGRDLQRTVQECVSAGLSAVIVREHDLPPDDRQHLLVALSRVPDLVVISSRIIDSNAAALHLAADQPPPAAAMPFGRSCHSRDEVSAAAEAGAVWVTLSPYAASGSKPGYGPPLPADTFAGHPLPVLALGGVHVANAAAARDAGAYGVAVMGAVMRSAEPAATVAALLREIA